MYIISEFSNISGLSKETLRYYTEAELLEPSFIVPVNKYRYYDDSGYFLAVLLIQLRGFGLSIQEMKRVKGDESFLNLETLLLKKRKNLLGQIEDLQPLVKEMDEFLASGKDEAE
ncbi:MerR family transcriptional regulator [Planococcus shenhongbingii]|uniref:MerR family transcriptional regulator n=1 Tax=Planococcus shenhongbingii TaxID=3058398 RepID=UPI00260CD82B|nr:MerR family transcriptional regulator [Planococcus sp. N016]WKA56860.1 MerR family transcriptional regulator [Planococcus sp. N016]